MVVPSDMIKHPSSTYSPISSPHQVKGCDIGPSSLIYLQPLPERIKVALDLRFASFGSESYVLGSFNTMAGKVILAI